jgi:hypothetical protein
MALNASLDELESTQDAKENVNARFRESRRLKPAIQLFRLSPELRRHDELLRFVGRFVGRRGSERHNSQSGGTTRLVVKFRAD